ncbi:hypothetical protein AAFF_G00042810 [Aldrovandia affinis]|uniref:Uncharacterized protein n=1 Tax=Aldrovandia affinis TaxID=143900 RepID=A0AAD7S2B5_9TELE|nr:hypothetical protein AAFF_G00042810 [Aldrovandia affinis]
MKVARIENAIWAPCQRLAFSWQPLRLTPGNAGKPGSASQSATFMETLLGLNKIVFSRQTRRAGVWLPSLPCQTVTRSTGQPIQHPPLRLTPGNAGKTGGSASQSATFMETLLGLNKIVFSRQTRRAGVWLPSLPCQTVTRSTVSQSSTRCTVRTKRLHFPANQGLHWRGIPGLLKGSGTVRRPGMNGSLIENEVAGHQGPHEGGLISVVKRCPVLTGHAQLYG